MKRYLTTTLAILTVLLHVSCSDTNNDSHGSHELAHNLEDQQVNIFDETPYSESQVPASPAENENNYLGEGYSPETRFAMAAMEGSMLEIQLGQLAQQKATSQPVKEFGQMMINDHRAASNTLSTIAEENSISLPSMLSSQSRLIITRLADLESVAFNREYTRLMVESHKEMLSLYMDYVEKTGPRTHVAGANADHEVQNWALKQIPLLQKHHGLAKRLLEAETTNITRKGEELTQ
ncbi:DUF4142 domain-containing protein [Telluribacter humicola]|uniref:DUF4142 domain-containing protein n=1 Tax=Telluribacter humicola TaxID=1720261 RepID=UPI001A976D37|nr:DUF4142 domain-containing protein [Telluribacter humicola]